MRKFILLCLLVFCAFSAFFMACEKNASSYVDDGKIVVGGEDVGVKDGKLTFYEANDLHISVSTIQDEIKTSAYVIENGLKNSVNVDFSNVNFGVSGEYEIIYNYGTGQITRKMFIYDMPEIIGNDNVSISYSKAGIGIFEGITAKDSFGNTIDLQILEDEGMFDFDGSWNVGEYNILFVAVDKAGQVVYFSRFVHILEERNPVILDSYSFDVNQKSFDFSLDSIDKSGFIGVSFDGNTVAPNYITSTENGFSVDRTFFYEYLLSEELVKNSVSGDKYVMSVLTDKGKTKTDFFLIDNDDIVYDSSPVDDFAKEIYPCYKPIKIAKAELLNPYQKVTPAFTLIKDGERRVAENGSFTFDKDGEWILEVDLRGSKIIKTLTTYYDLGLENGTVYGGANPFSNNLPDGYDLVEYCVTEHGNLGARYFVCSSLDDINTFSNLVNQLNTSKIYDMVVSATKSGQTFTQIASFSVVKDGVAVLSNSQNNDMVINNEEYTYLDYTQVLVGGRRGVYRWGANKAGSSGDKSKIIFGDDTIKAMKKGGYLTFDIYYTLKAVLLISFGDGYTYYAYNRGSYYSSREEDVLDNGSTSGVHADNSYYCGDIIKFFDANGNEIIRKNKDDDPLMKYQNKWITVQLMIETDNVPLTAGLQIYTANSALDLQEIYIANIRVSNSAIMEDDTEISILPENGVVNFPDIWIKEENN